MAKKSKKSLLDAVKLPKSVAELLKNPLVLIGVVLAAVAIVLIMMGGIGEPLKSLGTLGSVTKAGCDYQFKEWCKGYPNGGVDYDDFAVSNRDCKAKGSYRTCDQVNAALR